MAAQEYQNPELYYSGAGRGPSPWAQPQPFSTGTYQNLHATANVGRQQDPPVLLKVLLMRKMEERMLPSLGQGWSADIATLVSQSYKATTNVERQREYPAAGNMKTKGKMPGAWKQGLGEEITTSEPPRKQTQLWRPQDDRILLKMKAGERQAPWAEIISVLRDKPTTGVNRM